MTSFCVLVHQVLSEKVSTIKGKNLLPRGANSFLLEYTPFQKKSKSYFDSAASSEKVSVTLKKDYFFYMSKAHLFARQNSPNAFVNVLANKL